VSATLLIVWHSRTGLARQMADAIACGARLAARELQLEAALIVRQLPAEQAQAPDVKAADGMIFCAPENLASVSGEMKSFFDRCYYEVLEPESVAGRPYAIAVSAGSDGAGAARQMARIATGWRLAAVAEPLIVRSAAQEKAAILAPKILADEAAAACRELGGLMAARLCLAL
jgi:NAD(P)H-dependent FMN reductase